MITPPPNGNPIDYPSNNPFFPQPWYGVFVAFYWLVELVWVGFNSAYDDLVGLQGAAEAA